jgi:hypothetical protein
MTDSHTTAPSLDAALVTQVAKALQHPHFEQYCQQIQQLSSQLAASEQHCAAALLALLTPASPKPSVKSNGRWVRYRLAVGECHQVSREQIQAILIEESGVDKKRIGRIDIRSDYSLVDLPDGMPADIFQLLTEATLNQQRLAIKRVKPSRRRSPRDH